MVERRKFFLTLNYNKKRNNNKSNNHIRHLREDLHQKLHFKAMENLKMFKTSTVDHNLFKIWSQEDIKSQKNISFNKNIYYAQLSNGFNKTIQTEPRINSFNNINNKNKINNNNISIENKNNDKDNKNIYYLNKSSKKKNSKFPNKDKHINNQKNFNIFKNKAILEDSELNKEIVNSNPLLYNFNFNGKNNKNPLKIIPNDQLNTLKEIAFVENNIEDSEEFNNIKNDNQFEDLKKEENIIIDGKSYNKNDTYKIADKLLKKCNWNSNKVNYDSNFGKGKLMFTNGMTLKEFEEKYNLLP